MKKTFTNILLSLIVAAPLVSAEGENVQPGTRELCQSERTQIQEQRLLETRDVEQQAPKERCGRPLPLPEMDTERAVSDEKSDDLASAVAKADTYTTTHDGCFRYTHGINLAARSVELDDGTIWTISSLDIDHAANWLSSDMVVILPNEAWFSSYDYLLVNLNTGARLRANMTLGPIYNGLKTYWITVIDPLSQKLILNDGSVWKIGDYSVMKKWLVNDTVVIGLNDGWFSWSEPNILINVNMLNYARGQAL